VRHCLVALIALLVSACTSLPDASRAPAIANASSQTARQYWLSGRLSVRVNDRLDIAKITWARNADDETLQVFTPFGSQIAELSRASNGRVRLKRGDETREAESMTALTTVLFGVALDTDDISRWLQMADLVEGEMRPVTLKDGSVWRLTAERAKTVGAYRIFERLTAVNGDTTVRLFVDEWQPR
jgi:outer membrane biogenesis lipoprotein LolB